MQDGGDLSDDPSSSSTEHIACFTVHTRGRRLQPQPWISHATVSDPSPTAASPPRTTPGFETLVTTRDLICRRVDVSSLKQSSALSLRLPPSTVDSVYVVDNEYVPDLPPPPAAAAADIPSPTGTVSSRRATLMAAANNEPVQLTKTRCDAVAIL